MRVPDEFPQKYPKAVVKTIEMRPVKRSLSHLLEPVVHAGTLIDVKKERR
jgi:hypothetical protein